MDDIALLKIIKSLPKNKQEEVEDFAEFLLRKTRNIAQINTPKFGFAKGAFKILPGFDE